MPAEHRQRAPERRVQRRNLRRRPTRAATARRDERRPARAGPRSTRLCARRRRASPRTARRGGRRSRRPGRPAARSSAAQPARRIAGARHVHSDQHAARAAATDRGRGARPGSRSARARPAEATPASRSSVEAPALLVASMRSCDSSTMPMTLELRSNVRTDISSSSPRWNRTIDPSTSSPPITAITRHDSPSGLVGDHRASRLPAEVQGARQFGAVLASVRSCAPCRVAAAPRLTTCARFVEHQHAAAEQLRDRLAQRRQRRAPRQQRRHLLVRLGGRLDAAHVALQFRARLRRPSRARRWRARSRARSSSATAPCVASVHRIEMLCAVCCAVIAIGDEQQPDHLAFPDQRHADQRARCLPRERCRRASDRARSACRADSPAS